MPERLNWNDLKITLAIDRMGSLTGASEEIGIDPSTAGRRLSAIEEALGAMLFLRGRTGLTPTDAGHAVIARAKEIARGAARIQEEVHAVGGGPSNPSSIVRLFGNPWTLEQLAKTALPVLAEQYPKLQLKMLGGLCTPEQRAGEATVSLWFKSAPPETEISLKLGEIPYAVYVRRGSEADKIGWVAFRDDDSPVCLATLWHEAQVKEKERVVLVATDASVLRNAVHSGVGKGLLPMCLGETDPKLVRIGEGPPEMTRTLHLHCQPETVQSISVRAVIGWLRATFSTTFMP